jgi:transposase
MAETAFSAIKRTLGHHLTSVGRDIQELELMIRVIVHNIPVLIKSTQRGI